MAPAVASGVNDRPLNPVSVQPPSLKKFAEAPLQRAVWKMVTCAPHEAPTGVADVHEHVGQPLVSLKPVKYENGPVVLYPAGQVATAPGWYTHSLWSLGTPETHCWVAAQPPVSVCRPQLHSSASPVQPGAPPLVTTAWLALQVAPEGVDDPRAPVTKCPAAERGMTTGVQVVPTGIDAPPTLQNPWKTPMLPFVHVVCPDMLHEQLHVSGLNVSPVRKFVGFV